jgi:hypothetical protein
MVAWRGGDDSDGGKEGDVDGVAERRGRLWRRQRTGGRRIHGAAADWGARWGGFISRLHPGVAADWREPGRAREVGWGQGAERREA